MADKQKTKEYSRRDFLKTSGAVTGGFIGGSLLGGLVGFNLEGITEEEVTADTEVDKKTVSSQTDSSDTLQEARMFFKRQSDFDILSAATEVIYPEDDLGPGSIGLGVPFFIDKQLAGSWGGNENMYMSGPFQEGEVPLIKRDIFLQGVRVIDEVSLSEFDKSFVDLEEEQQIEVLQLLESGEVDMDLINSASFFQILRQSTLEGAFSDPLYGGNKNMAGWKMKEFPGAQTSYRHLMKEDQKSDSDFISIEPISLSSQG